MLYTVQVSSRRGVIASMRLVASFPLVMCITWRSYQVASSSLFLDLEGVGWYRPYSCLVVVSCFPLSPSGGM